MRAAEKKLVERNLNLIFEFEKYVLDHPEITKNVSRNAVVFMKVAAPTGGLQWVSAID